MRIQNDTNAHLPANKPDASSTRGGSPKSPQITRANPQWHDGRPSTRSASAPGAHAPQATDDVQGHSRSKRQVAVVLGEVAEGGVSAASRAGRALGEVFQTIVEGQKPVPRMGTPEGEEFIEQFPVELESEAKEMFSRPPYEPSTMSRDDWPKAPGMDKVAPRPELPTLAPESSDEQVIKSVFEKSRGMILGEEHVNDAATRFVTDNMKTLKENGVTDIYLENVDRSLQGEIDKYLADEKGGLELPQSLKDKLSEDERIHESQGYDEADVLKAAKQYGVRVHGTETDETNLAAENNNINDRLKSYNLSVTRQIEEDLQKEGHRNYVLIVGSSHTGDEAVAARGAALGTSYPGIDRMTGGISIRIDYVRGGETAGIRPGTNIEVPEEPTSDEGFNEVAANHRFFEKQDFQWKRVPAHLMSDAPR